MTVGKQTVRYKDRQTDCQIDKMRDRKMIYRQTEKPLDRETDRQPDG